MTDSRGAVTLLLQVQGALSGRRGPSWEPSASREGNCVPQPGPASRPASSRFPCGRPSLRQPLGPGGQAGPLSTVPPTPARAAQDLGQRGVGAKRRGSCVSGARTEEGGVRAQRQASPPWTWVRVPWKLQDVVAGLSAGKAVFSAARPRLREAGDAGASSPAQVRLAFPERAPSTLAGGPREKRRFS